MLREFQREIEELKKQLAEGSGGEEVEEGEGERERRNRRGKKRMGELIREFTSS